MIVNTGAGHAGPASVVRSRKREETSMSSNDSTIRPFRVEFPEEEIAGLRRRIAATRWPDRETVTDDSSGVRLGLWQSFDRYWGTDYDWGKSQENLTTL